MTVHILGAGPGDAELLTLKAIRILGTADAVVHDRLIGDDILDFAPPSAERYDVGKTPGTPGPSQDEINHLLVALGRRLDSVVRVKGGDPSVFGRGAEEAEACHDAGVRTQTVPGISSAVAAPNAAGISVTRRGVASGFCVVTAKQDAGSAPIDWAALARSGLTLVVLMGASRAGLIRDRLLVGGMAVDTPVAIVTDASLPSQRTRRLPLAELGAGPVDSPSVLVIGAVADQELCTLAMISHDTAATRSLVTSSGNA
jgi:uroporphyrin-III C-methyltransferase